MATFAHSKSNGSPPHFAGYSGHNTFKPGEMIHNVLQALCKDLSQFLKSRLGVPEEEGLVVLSELMKMDGSVAVTAENRMVCSLLSVEQERININAPRINNKTLTNPPFNLNLYVLFSAFWAAPLYVEALKALSYTIGFFQGKQVFTPANTPGLDPTIEKITIEIVNIDLKDMSNFWTALGAKHLPCMLFRIRMVSITSDIILEETPEIRTLDTQ